MKKNTILTKIIIDKYKIIKKKKYNKPIKNFYNLIKPSIKNFYNIFFKKNISFILEYKKKSPSKGIININFDILTVINTYRDYATVISIITDKEYFNGNFIFLKKISKLVYQPLLCKDFIIHPWQIYYARLNNADAILLILSVLNDKNYKKLAKIANKLRMGILTEISNKKECIRAINLKAKIIGINNRNLHNFSININNFNKFLLIIPKNIFKIYESGVKNFSHIRKLCKIANGFLIGTSLMQSNDLNKKTRKILFGYNKICGLTRNIDAYVVMKSGAIYGGLIFVNSSKRCLNIHNAKNIILGIQLNFVGVFKNAPIKYIINIVNFLSLSIIQLHGYENQKYINKLRYYLPYECKIWKAFNMKLGWQNCNLNNIDKYILDNGKGGTGKSFDWSLLDNKNLNNIILSGGINLNNYNIAVNIGCFGLDLNSGIEINQGIKNHDKLKIILKKIYI